MADESKNAELMRRVKERFKLAQEWEETARQRFVADLKFCEGDADNGYQWPDRMMKARELDDKPTLTVNRVRQHVLQVLNDMRKNKMQCRVSPVGDGATYKSAQAMEDVIRHIEYQSNAIDAYMTAAEYQVRGGIGYWRVVTDYVNDRSFDQEIYIRRVKDPLTILLDPDIQEADGSDARFAFVFEDIPEDEFEKKYPKFKGKAPQPFEMTDDWLLEDHIRICEYYERTEKKDRLYSTDDGTVLKSEMPPEVWKGLEKDDTVRKRDILTQDVHWYLIIGNEVADDREIPCDYIPIVRVVGEETIIDGKMDRKGHVRALKDPQRMYNYWTSAAVEMVALQTKVPYTIPIEATEGVEEYWETANRVNHAYLPYKAFTDDGSPIPPPQRALPPQQSQAILTGMQTASAEMMVVSGQYQAQMGAPSNERTGVAIQERQAQGDNATYHYIDHMASAIRFTGKILLSMIPRVYDTERTIMIVQENGNESQIGIRPSQQDAIKMQQNQEAVQSVLNPSVGRYSVQSDVGPEFSTRRQEAFNAMMQLASASPDFMQRAGDLVMKAADFPMADDLADRLKPPEVDPNLQAAQAQIQNMQNIIQTMTEELAKKEANIRATAQQKDIDVYKAETDRMEAMAKVNPQALSPLIHQLVQDAIKVHLGSVFQASQSSLQTASPAVQSAQL